MNNWRKILSWQEITNPVGWLIQIPPSKKEGIGVDKTTYAVIRGTSRNGNYITYMLGDDETQAIEYAAENIIMQSVTLQTENPIFIRKVF